MGDHFGFIGVGRMGSAMAARLLQAGHSLVIHDVDASAVNALVLHTAALGDQGLAGGQSIELLVDLSTSGPRMAKQVARGLAEHDIAMLDAPVSGGVASARKGTLALMVSGPRSRYVALQQVLATLGKLFFVGEAPGLGQTAKLANNLISACALAITAEAVAMGSKAGLDPAVLIEVLNASSGRSSASEDKWPKAVLPRSFNFGFTTGLAFKDVRLCLDEAEAMGVPMVVGSAVRQILSITNNQFGPDADFTVIARLVEQWSGIEEPAVTEEASA